MRQVIFCTAERSEASHGVKVSARLLRVSPAPDARDASSGRQDPDTALPPSLGLGADDSTTQGRFKSSRPRAAKAPPSHANPRIGVNYLGAEATYPPGLVTLSLQPVTLTSQARNAKYIFASQTPTGPGVCVMRACNVYQTPPSIPFGNSLSCPVERHFDRAVHIPDLTDTPPVGNSSQKTESLFSFNIRSYCAHLKNRSEQ
jgi:hypothetical protein